MEPKWRWNVPPSALRDNADPETQDRIWARLEEELPQVRREKQTRAWAPLAVAAAFLGGIWVGGTYFPGQTAGTSAAPLQAEPLAAPAPVASPVAPQRDPQAKQKPTEKKRHRVPAKPPLAAPTDEQAEEPEQEVTAPVEAPVAPEAPVGQTEPAAPAWQSLAERGDYAEALAEIHARGGFEIALASANSEQLMLLVDVARATGQRPLAIVALRRVVDQYKIDPLAPLAAWSLGVMLEKEGDRPGAAASYGVYRSLSPQGDFAEDALARQVRIALDLGQRDTAANLAKQYIAEYPNSTRADKYRARFAEPTADAPAAVSDEDDDGAEAPESPATDPPADPDAEESESDSEDD